MFAPGHFSQPRKRPVHELREADEWHEERNRFCYRWPAIRDYFPPGKTRNASKSGESLSLRIGKATAWPSYVPVSTGLASPIVRLMSRQLYAWGFSLLP